MEFDRSQTEAEQAGSQIHNRQNQWFVDSGHGPIGPFLSAEIYQMYMSGEINSNSKLWRQGEKNWNRLVEIDELWLSLNPDLSVRQTHKTDTEDQANKAMHQFDVIPPLPDLHDLSDLPQFPNPPESLKKAWSEKFQENWSDKELQFESEQAPELNDGNVNESPAVDVIALTEQMTQKSVLKDEEIPPPLPQERFEARFEIATDLTEANRTADMDLLRPSETAVVVPEIEINRDETTEIAPELQVSPQPPRRGRKFILLAAMFGCLSMTLVAGIQALRFVPQVQHNHVKKQLAGVFKATDLNQDFFSDSKPRWKIYTDAQARKIYLITNMVADYTVDLTAKSSPRDNLASQELDFKTSSKISRHVAIFDQIKHLKGVQIAEGNYQVNLKLQPSVTWTPIVGALNTLERFMKRSLLSDPNTNTLQEQNLKLSLSTGMESQLQEELKGHQSAFDQEVLRPLETMQENYKTLLQAIDWTLSKSQRLAKINNASRIFITEYDKKFGPLVQGLLTEYQNQKMQNFKGDLSHMEVWGEQFIGHLKRFGQAIAGLQDNFQLRPAQRSTQDLTAITSLRTEILSRIEEINIIRNQNNP